MEPRKIIYYLTMTFGKRLHLLGSIRRSTRQNSQQASPPTLSRKRKAPGASSVASSLTIDSPMTTSSSKRSARVSDQSLHPTRALSIHLGTKYNHLPQRTTTLKARCAIHRWVGVEMRSSIFFCLTCNVNLCVDYYKHFHQNMNIVRTKKTILNQLTM